MSNPLVSVIIPTYNTEHSLSLSGRLRIINQLAKKKKFSLDIGSKNVRFGDVNIDLDSNCYPDVIANAILLPFKSDSFQRVFFTEVIEHLPKGYESISLREIHRVLGRSGELILTTPQRNLIFLLLDPAWYIFQHRHYTISEIKYMLNSNGFRLNSLFSSGFLWTCINTLWHCIITYPMERLLGVSLPYGPNKLRILENQEYEKRWQKGYTIFVKASKVRT